MRVGEMVTAGILALFSIYLMWKSTELPIGYIAGHGTRRRGLAVLAFGDHADLLRRHRLQLVAWDHPPSQSDEPLLDSHGWRSLLFVGGGIIGFVALDQHHFDVRRDRGVPVLLPAVPGTARPGAELVHVADRCRSCCSSFLKVPCGSRCPRGCRSRTRFSTFSTDIIY